MSTATTPRQRAIERAKLDTCTNCTLDRDTALEAAELRDDAGRWRGGLYAGLLASCLGMCGDYWPAWYRRLGDN